VGGCTRSSGTPQSDGLPARQREALVGSTVQGLSRAELATTLGVSEGAVRQLVHRARRAIRTAITSLTPYPVLRRLTGPAGGVVAKLGTVAAAGAIAASGLAAGHHGSPRPMHAARPAPLRSRSATTVAASARTGADPRVTAASAGEFVAVSPGDAHRVTVPARAAGRGGSARRPGMAPGLGRAGALLTVAGGNRSAARAGMAAAVAVGMTAQTARRVRRAAARPRGRASRRRPRPRRQMPVRAPVMAA